MHSFQHKSAIEIGKQPIRDFLSLVTGLLIKKSSIHFGEGKTKSIFFGTKHDLRNAKSLNIVYNGTEIKHEEVELFRMYFR